MPFPQDLSVLSNMSESAHNTTIKRILTIITNKQCIISKINKIFLRIDLILKTFSLSEDDSNICILGTDNSRQDF